MLRSIVSRLLICAAVLVAAPIGATGAPGGSSTAQIGSADQVALGAAKPADGRMIQSAGRKPDLGARLSVVLGIIPDAVATPLAPSWCALDSSSRRAASLPAHSVPSCKTSRGPPHASLET